MHAVTQPRSVRDVLQMVVASACELIGARYGALGIPDEEGRFAEFYTVGVSDEERERIGPLPRTHGLLGAMLREARPQRIPDVRSDPRFNWWPAAHPILTDFLGVPIIDDEVVVGAIYLPTRPTSKVSPTTTRRCWSCWRVMRRSRWLTRG